MNKITCSICIATYKRKDMLRNLLLSLLDQVLPDNVFLEIIVVDNDEAQSAKDTVLNIKTNESSSFTYLHQPVKNISMTRNMGINNATGQYIAFIDDDEIADKQWIYHLLSTSNKYDADGVFGYVDAIFPSDTPDWLKQRTIFFKPMRETGSSPLFLYTTNCLIKSDIIKNNNVQFDIKYGLTGGEDSIFCEKLRDCGAKFVTCREAVSYETVIKERLNIKYIYSRYFQVGNIYSRRMIDVRGNELKGKRSILFVKAILTVIYYSLKLIIFLPFKKRWVFSLIKFSANLGKLTGVFNFNYQHY